MRTSSPPTAGSTRTQSRINREPLLEFDDGTFDAATICVSIQYLVHPLDVLREAGASSAAADHLHHVLEPLLSAKAVAISQALDDAATRGSSSGICKTPETGATL